MCFMQAPGRVKYLCPLSTEKSEDTRNQAFEVRDVEDAYGSTLKKLPKIKISFETHTLQPMLGSVYEKSTFVSFRWKLLHFSIFKLGYFGPFPLLPLPNSANFRSSESQWTCPPLRLSVTNFEKTILWQACIDDNLEMVEFLVDHGADVNRGDNEGWTPLHATASCGFLSIAKCARLLLTHLYLTHSILAAKQFFFSFFKNKL